MKTIKTVGTIGICIMAVIGALYSILLGVFFIDTVKAGAEEEMDAKPVKEVIVKTWRRKYAQVQPKNERRYGF